MADHTCKISGFNTTLPACSASDGKLMQRTQYMGGTPKWLVYRGKSHLGMDDLGVPLFQETSTLNLQEIR